MNSNSNRHLAEERIIVIKPGKIDRVLAQKSEKMTRPDSPMITPVTIAIVTYFVQLLNGWFP
jgi:hypothetical protein